jgi:hypothetical protein
MAKTLFTLLPAEQQLGSAIEELASCGVAVDDISVIARDRTELSASAGKGTTQDMGAGSGSGTLVGMLAGLISGVETVQSPEFGTVVVGGPLARWLGSTALGPQIGQEHHGLREGLLDRGVAEREVEALIEGIQAGAALVSVDLSDDAVSDSNRDGAHDCMRRIGEGRLIIADFSGGALTPERSTGELLADSSKVGTAAGTIAGATAGATIGSLGGPIGAIVGGVVGAITGAGAGVAGDVAGEAALPAGDYHSVGDTAADHEQARTHRAASFDRYEPLFRNHYQSSLATSGEPYERFTQVYRLGFDLGRSPLYRQSGWSTAQSEAERIWERENPGTWLAVRDAVAYAFERGRE